jgi:hypothetical protein
VKQTFSYHDHQGDEVQLTRYYLVTGVQFCLPGSNWVGWGYELISYKTIHIFSRTKTITAHTYLNPAVAGEEDLEISDDKVNVTRILRNFVKQQMQEVKKRPEGEERVKQLADKSITDIVQYID